MLTCLLSSLALHVRCINSGRRGVLYICPSYSGGPNKPETGLEPFAPKLDMHTILRRVDRNHNGRFQNFDTLSFQVLLAAAVVLVDRINRWERMFRHT